MAKSMTIRNGRGSHRHNVRDYIEMPEHIDVSLSHMNETLVDVPLWQFYRDTFQPAIDEYNAQQKRADRKIPDAMQYLKDIQAETGDKARKPYYETFVQIGDRNDTGITDCETEKTVLKKFIKEWDKRNPHMKMIGAYIHADESNGTIHAHIDWVPVADDYQRGMRVQNGLKRALKQQGFEGTSKKFNAYLGWQESERNALERIALQHGIERKETKRDHSDWRDKETYIAEQKLKEQLDRIALVADVQSVEPKKPFLRKDKVLVDEIDFGLVKSAALAAPALKNEVQDLRDIVRDQRNDMEHQKAVEDYLRRQLELERQEHRRQQWINELTKQREADYERMLQFYENHMGMDMFNDDGSPKSLLQVAFEATVYLTTGERILTERQKEYLQSAEEQYKKLTEEKVLKQKLQRKKNKSRER